MSDEMKMVIVVDRSIKMGPGKMAAQVGHAAVSCALAAERYDKRNFDAWMAEGQQKVVVRVDTNKELLRTKMAADDLGLTNALIKDAGHTQLAPGTTTCLGIGPAKQSVLDQVTGDLKLL